MLRLAGNVSRGKKGNIRPIPPVQRFFRPGLLDFGTLALGGQLLISAISARTPPPFSMAICLLF